MPDIERMEVLVQAHDQASAVLDRVGGKFGILRKEGLAVGAGFAAVTMGLSVLQRTFTGLQQWLGDSITKFREFERSMSEVATMLNEMDERLLPEMTRAIEGMSMAFGKSAVDLSRGMYQILSAGIDASGSIDVLRESSKLATATLTDVETAVDAVTTVLNAYSMDASQAGRITDIMAKTIQLGKLRMDELANSLGGLITVAAQAGVSFEEISAAIATLTKQGIHADMAAHGLRQAINNIISPSVEAKTAMGELGVSFDDLTLEAIGVGGVMEKINNATGGQIGLISQLIPNIRALSAALGLMTNNGELLSSSLDYIRSDFNALNEMYSDVASSTDFLAKKNQMLGENIDREIGESLEGTGRAFETTINVLKLFVKNFGNVESTAKDYASVLYEAEEATDAAFDVDKTNEYIAVFDKLNDEIDSQSNLLTQLTQRQELYHQELADLETQRNILIATHDYTEALHYIPLALKDATYTNKIFDNSIRALVDSIRIQREEIEKLEEANNQLNIQTRASNIEQLQIQLRASQHRGRLTRDEKQRLEELKRADLERRIATLQNQQEIDNIKNKGLTEEEKRLEIVKTTYAEQVRTIQDSYNQELNALNNQIKAKELLIKDYYGYIEKIQNEHLEATRLYISEYSQLYEASPRTALAIDPRAFLQTWYKKHGGILNVPGFQYGGVVPGSIGQPQLVMAHGGEKITPATGGQNVKIEFPHPIQINMNIRDVTDIEGLARKIELAVQSGLISGIATEYG